MNEQIEYAEMLEIPVSTVNVVRKNQRRKKADDPALKESVIATVNDRVNAAEEPQTEGSLNFDPLPERIDTVRLYSQNGDNDELYPYDYDLNEGGMYATNAKASRSARVALGVELGLACALCCGIFLTNVFVPDSAINTFFRAMNTPQETTTVVRPYTDYDLTPVVSELSEAKLTLSDSGVLSFTEECCVYPAADGTVASVTQDADGLYTLKVEYSDAFTGVFTGLDSVYYAAGDTVKANVPVGYSEGETEVQVTMFSEGVMLNCFELTEENCLAWSVNAQ